ncbi:histidine phosphatase family protein [Paenibacillus albus]|uniref:histidine phosphatase family protein n=1 Tax=Paenibacillus albus TaxID=2495582 RepID=UPI0013DE9F28|nr:histidine phosphatase family protein [Paenibacillus albus]
MEIIFVRHGQGVHNTNIPDRLNTVNPHLTERGRQQVTALKSEFAFHEDDVFIVSPTIRTIETVNIMSSDLNSPHKYVSPLVGPRMFPMPSNPEAFASKCDLNYPLCEITKDHSDFIVLEEDNQQLWNLGVNTLKESEFIPLGWSLINWLKKLAAKRVFIVAHDGTITNYRILLGESGLTRSDFLGEAGWYKMNI